MLGSYNEAIAEVVRQGAPLASFSIDRRCLYNYTRALRDDAVESLMCFSCARRFPFLANRRSNDISWEVVLGRVSADGVDDVDQRTVFCNLGIETTKAIYGLETFIAKYGRVSDEVHLSNFRSEYDDWQLTIPFGHEDVKILCCPEDRLCKDEACMASSTACPRCRMRLCNECKSYLHKKGKPAMPPVALTNDMMVYYAPRELYTKNVTVMEMICASVCLTSMICFTLEAKYRKENPFDATVHMSRHRMGARGNATCFPLPWEELLQELRGSDRENVPNLPWVGEELSNFVSVLLKTSDDEDPKALAKFVHQARVRRAVVVKLIEDAKRRGHRAYARVDIATMREKATSLPEDGVPPEIIRLLPHDNHLDKILVQKAACPVGGRSDLDGAAEIMTKAQPNAVVLEKSSHDEADINAQRIAN